MSEEAFDITVNMRVMAKTKAIAIDKVKDLLNQLAKLDDIDDYTIREEL